MGKEVLAECRSRSQFAGILVQCPAGIADRANWPHIQRKPIIDYIKEDSNGNP